MKKRIAPLQIGSLARSIFAALLLLTLLWSLISRLFLGDILISRPLLVANLVLSAILGWFLYRYYIRIVFLYDDEGFELHKGQRIIGGKWGEFSTVSLVHVGGGNFVIRLYRDVEEFLDLPASALRLDPHQFRFEVMKFMGENPTRPSNEKRLNNFPAS